MNLKVRLPVMEQTTFTALFGERALKFSEKKAKTWNTMVVTTVSYTELNNTETVHSHITSS